MFRLLLSRLAVRGYLAVAEAGADRRYDITDPQWRNAAWPPPSREGRAVVASYSL